MSYLIKINFLKFSYLCQSKLDKCVYRERQRWLKRTSMLRSKSTAESQTILYAFPTPITCTSGTTLYLASLILLNILAATTLEKLHSRIPILRLPPISPSSLTTASTEPKSNNQMVCACLSPTFIRKVGTQHGR